MGVDTRKIILSLILLSILINPVEGQDYYYRETTYKFSEQLKVGMEFTWEFKKFSFEFINNTLGFNQEISTVTETVTGVITSTTTARDNGPNTETTTVTSEEVFVDFPEVPDVPVSMLYTIRILKDIGNLTDEYLFDVYEDEAENYYGEYFDISVSSGDAATLIPFFGINGFIYPAVIEYKNGTRVNAFEFQYQEYLEMSTEDFGYQSDTDISIIDGVYIESSKFTQGNITINTSQQTHVETGILLSVSGFVSSPDFLYEVEVELYEPDKKDLNNLEPNGTLSLPISPISVYSLFLIPIITNKLKSKNNK